MLLRLRTGGTILLALCFLSLRLQAQIATEVTATPLPAPATTLPTVPPYVTPNPMPTAPPVFTPTPPPVVTPTVPPPPPTPTVPPPPPTPSVPPVIPPEVSLPAVPTSANPQFARVVVNQSLSLKNVQGRFQKVALQPGQTVNVVMTLTEADVGQLADVEVLDGGAIAGTAPPVSLPQLPIIQSLPVPLWRLPVSPTPLPSPCQTIDCQQPIVPDPPTLADTSETLPVSLTGQLSFNFRPGDGPGLHRVSVIVGGNQYTLQFWQQDPAAPNNNPNMLRAY